MTKAEWVTAQVAAEIISANSGRPIIQQYVRDLAQKNKIKYKALDGRTNVYLRSDVEKIVIKQHKRSKSQLPEESVA